MSVCDFAVPYPVLTNPRRRDVNPLSELANPRQEFAFPIYHLTIPISYLPIPRYQPVAVWKGFAIGSYKPAKR